MPANSDTPPTASVTPPKPRSKSPKKKRLKPKSSDGSPSKIGPSQPIPGATLEQDLQDGGPQGIPPKTLELFSQIVFNSTTKQFVEAIQTAFEELCFYSLDDIRDVTSSELGDSFEKFPKDLKLRGANLVRLKRLIDFLQPSTVLEDDLTSRQIQIVLEERKLAAAASLVTPEKPFDRKKDIKLKPWNGEGDTIHPWRDAVEMSLGKIGLVDSISDPSFYDKDPDSSQQVFYALCEALKDGSAHHYAKDVETVTGRKCAHDLMEKLLTTFNTEESKVHFMVHAVELLFNIVLDHNVTVETFISDWKSIVHRLEQNASVLAEKSILRVFLLRAIRSSEYDDVIRFINSNPLLPIDDYLKELRAKETNIKMLNGDDPTVKDGDMSSITRRTQKQTSFSRKSDSKKSDEKFPPWNIPPFPDGFARAMNSKVFSVFDKWRNYAHKRVISPVQLNKMFALTVIPSSQRTNKRNRRTGTDDELATEEDVTDPPPSKKSKKEGKVRIQLAYKSRRLNGKMAPQTITEVDASSIA